MERATYFIVGIRSAAQVIRKEIERGREMPFLMSIFDKKGKRSLAQNSLLHRWISEAAASKRCSPEEEKGYVKLLFGVPILRADPEFNEFYLLTKIGDLIYEDAIKAMRFIRVTSTMSTKELSELLDAYERECLENGINLSRNIANDE